MNRRMVSCIAFFLAFWCVACGQQTAGIEAQSSVAESKAEVIEDFQTVGDTYVTNQREFGNANCLVQIQTDTQRGSGVLWDKQEDFWTIVTAAHVVEGLEQAEVYLVTEDKMCCARVHCIEGLDLAFLQVDVEQIGDDIAANYEECVPIETEPKSNEKISAIGYSALAEKCNYEGVVLEPWIYTEDFENYMLLCQCDAEAGMSGGGVFNEEGTLTGIVCGQNNEGQLAVLPTIVIEGEVNVFINY